MASRSVRFLSVKRKSDPEKCVLFYYNYSNKKCNIFLQKTAAISGDCVLIPNY